FATRDMPYLDMVNSARDSDRKILATADEFRKAISEGMFDNVHFNLKPPVKCYNCAKPGHYATECTEPKSSEKKCFKCQGIGHIARNCTAT
ncbi:hypothetical protein PMAYCL1PPCAC_20094, partial [Pristionchus mayeri]